jgi:glucose/arabinose dehydrogenase
MIDTVTPTPAPVAPASAPGAPGTVSVSVSEMNTVLANPWGFAFLPDRRILVTERPGTLKLLSAGGGVEGNISGVPAVLAQGQGGLLDVALDPAFATNRRIYLSYAERDAANPAINGTAVARAVLDVATFSLSSVTVIYRQQPKVASITHFGSRLVFDRTGALFVTMGERELDSERGFAQDLTRGNGKIVRITTDGAPAPGNPVWTVPGAQPEIFSLGHRNPQGAALHPDSGELWSSEHGAQGGDEINRVLAGRNYGWPLSSFSQEYGTMTPVGPTSLAGTEPPLWVWETITGEPFSGSGFKSSIAPAGIAFYTGTAVPQWRGSLFVTALAGTALWRLTLSGNTVIAQERLLASRAERLRDVKQGADGALYLLTDNGKLLRYGA